MTEAAKGESGGFDQYAEARMYGEYYGITQAEDEGNEAYRSRVAGELRKQGKIIEAHEVASGRRWNDPDQGPTGPMAGIFGAVAQAMQGIEYSPDDPEQQIGDDIAAGVVAMAPKDNSGEAIMALFDLVGPEAGMDVLETFSRKPNEELVTTTDIGDDLMSETTGSEEVRAFGSRLREHVDAWETGATEAQFIPDDFMVGVAKAFADYLGEGGVIPMGYINARELFINDCITGINGYTGHPMPSSIAGYPPIIYALFRMHSIDLARGAFGDQFADEANDFWKKVVATIPDSNS